MLPGSEKSPVLKTPNFRKQGKNHYLFISKGIIEMNYFSCVFSEVSITLCSIHLFFDSHVLQPTGGSNYDKHQSQYWKVHSN